MAVFGNGWDEARGCKIEHLCCVEYGIPTREIDDDYKEVASMWEKVKECATGLVLWAETELAGKTGKEKRKTVVTKLREMIDWPVIPEFIEAIFEPILYGFVVDKVCDMLNLLTDGDFKDVVLDEPQTQKVAALIGVKPDGEPVMPVEPVKTLEAAAPDMSGLDARLNALYAKYAVKS